MVSTGLPNAVVTGFVTGSVIAMGAIGLALVYSIAEVPNFAHGELLTLGAFMALFANTPSEVPVFELLTTGEQAITLAGLAVLFGLAAGATLSLVYLLGGWEAMRGSWWPVEPPPPVAIVVHLGVATLVGALVALGAPSIWSGVLLATVLVGVIAPGTEMVVSGPSASKVPRWPRCSSPPSASPSSCGSGPRPSTAVPPGPTTSRTPRPSSTPPSI